MRKSRPPIELTAKDRRTLQGWAAGGDAALAVRARLALLAADGVGLGEASRRLGCGQSSASRWRRLFLEGGPQALIVRPAGAGRTGWIGLDPGQRAALESWARGEGGRPGLDRKAKALLLLAEGASHNEAARRTGAAPATVAGWRRRLVAGGLKALSSDRTPPIEVSGAERDVLERWARDDEAQPGLEIKAQAMLHLADGANLSEAARRTGAALSTVSAWRLNFLGGGLESLSSRRQGPIGLDGGQRASLERLAGGNDARLARRAKAILMAAEGESALGTARQLGVSPGTVGVWRRMFLAHGLDAGFEPSPRAGVAARLGAGDRAFLERLAEGGDPKPAARAKAILMAAEGATAAETARRTGLTRNAVAAGLRLFLERGLEAGFAGAGEKRAAVSPDAGQRALLESWAGGGDAALAMKAKLILLAADGLAVAEAARRLGCDPSGAFKWRKLFLEGGPRALDARGSRPRRFELDAGRRRELEELSGARDARLAAAAKALLAVADGGGVAGAAKLAGISRGTLCKSMDRFLKDGPGGLARALPPGGGRAPGTAPLGLDAAQRSVLERWARGGGGGGVGGDGGEAARMSLRARLVLMAADGLDVKESARRAGASPSTAEKWRRRFAGGGTAALFGRPPKRAEAGRIDDGRLAVLAGWARGEGAGFRLAARAKAVLALVQGGGFPAAIRSSGLRRKTASRWLGRFLAAGPEGLFGPGGGGPGRPRRRLAPTPVDGARRRVLEGWARGEGKRPGLDRKAKAMLLIAGGAPLKEAGRAAGVGPSIVSYWRKAFLAGGLQALAPDRTEPIALDPGQRRVLEGWARGEGKRPGLDKRAKVILLGADGLSSAEAGRLAGVPPNTARAWRRSFLAGGLRALRPGGKEPIALDPGRRLVLEGWARGEGKRPGLDRKAKTMLMLADGLGLGEAARLAGVSRAAAGLWRRRFLEGGPEALVRPVDYARRTDPSGGRRRESGLPAAAKGGGQAAGGGAEAAAAASSAIGPAEAARPAGIGGAVADGGAGGSALRLPEEGPGGLPGSSPGGPARPAPPRVKLDAAERAFLERRARGDGDGDGGWRGGGGSPASLAVRARAILMAADGWSAAETARRTGVSRVCVNSWLKLFQARRLGDFLGRPSVGGQAVRLGPGQRGVLERWAEGGGGGSDDAKLALKAKVILLAADGAGALETVRRTGVSCGTVSTWRRLFLAHGLEAGFSRSSTRSVAVGLDPGQRAVLESWAGGGDAKLAAKARLVLLTAEGVSLAEASRRLGCRPMAAYYWRRLFLEGGPRALEAVRGGSRASRPELGDGRRRELERLAGGHGRPAAMAKALLSVADGAAVGEAARLAGASRSTFRHWRRRLLEAAPGGGSVGASPGGRARGPAAAVKLDAARRELLERWAGGGADAAEGGGGGGGGGRRRPRRPRRRHGRQGPDNPDGRRRRGRLGVGPAGGGQPPHRVQVAEKVQGGRARGPLEPPGQGALGGPGR